MPYLQKNRMCSVTTKLGKDVLLLRRFTGTEGLSRLFSFQLDLLSVDDSINFNDLIGTNISISMLLSNGSTRHFHGIIIRCTQGGADKRFVAYKIEMVPWLWLLTRRTDCRIFQEKSVPEIIEQVFNDLNLADFEFKLSGSYDPRTYCVQYRETDFNFISRLMEDEGIFYFFKHEEGRHVLVLGDDSSVHESCPEEDAIYVGTMEKPETEDFLTDLQLEQVLHPGKISLSDYNFETPNVDLLVNTGSKVKVGDNDSLEIYDYHPGQYPNVEKGEAFSKIRMEEQETRAVSIQGTGNCRSFISGHLFTLQGHYQPKYDKKAYVLTSIMHTFNQPAFFETGQVLEINYENHFKCIPQSLVYRPPRLTSKPRITGPQTAVVVGPSGEEIYTDKYGRVKVLFHWDRNGAADETSSCWIRISESWAGKNWGTIFLPRVGQEVIVEFLEGDPDQPIITGRVYNAQQMPPYELPSEQTKSTIKSLSSKGGGGFNEIRFEDKKDDEEFFIHAQKNIELRALNDRKESIGNDRHLTVKRDKLEKVERDKHLIVERDEIQEITRDHNFKVKGKEAIEVGDSRSITVKGDVIEVFKGNHSESVSGDCYVKGMNVVIEAMTGLTIKVGSNFITLNAGGVAITGTSVMINSGGAPLSGVAGQAVAPGVPLESIDAVEEVAGEVSEAAKARSAILVPWHKEPDDEAEEKSWIEIELVDEEDNPVAGERYRIILPDGETVAEGTTGADGIAKVKGIDPGTCKITFPNLDKDAWEKV